MAFITDRGTYCYKVMPFGLKNAGATYQRLVNKMFAERLGVTMEVYIHDMLVKSKMAADHIDHLKDCFLVLNKYDMKLNPTKCTFGVTPGEFLGYTVTQRGIKANPKQISTILDLPSPRECLPFNDLLLGNKKFIWDERCEEAFEQLKHYLTTPLVLAKPEKGDTLYLYIAVSDAVVSNVLDKEERGEQRPIFYTSQSMTDAETRYSTLKKMALAVMTSARKLRPKYDVTFQSRPSTKSQVLADFLIELTPELEHDLQLPNGIWILHVDGSSSSRGSEIGFHLQSPTGELLQQSFRLGFKASNNEADYESLIAGLHLAQAVQAKCIQAYCDCQLVSNQFRGDYDAKNEQMDAYLKVAQDLANESESFQLTRIPRGENVCADALAVLGSNPRDQAKCANYVAIEGRLHLWTSAKVLLTCLSTKEAALDMAETHEGAAVNHSGGRALSLKVKSMGFTGQPWSLIAKRIPESATSASDTPQRHAPYIYCPTELLQSSTAPYPFMRWAIDIVGPMTSSRQRKYILIMTDYFTKWVEAKAFVQVTDNEVQNFIWKNIICRHGVPYEIVTDNGSQFISNNFCGFYERWAIRLNRFALIPAMQRSS
ncbi:uncharacterized protein LOC125586057 [Brassica napus]|uniref:uncharacterized protein LOC125586057 n=1 Tax=Brassica napus TaxID=3708 RepID=UPI002079C911|nr:uncharacterized protein LOC125586057 [Brassica napus]